MVNSNFSWTFSKITPYLLLVILGVLIARWFTKFLLFKLISNRLKFMKSLVFCCFMAIPFVIGFILNPIYEGDFSKQGTEINRTISLNEFKNEDLSVIAIPGCPFCYHSISKLKILQQRNPKMRINFIVCSNNPEDLKVYQEEAGKEINVRLTKNSLQLEQMAEGRFPTFVMHRQNKPVYKWSNDQFGCLAMDQLESEIKE
jgi:hypothetical protein